MSKNRYNFYQVFYTDLVNNMGPRVIGSSTDRERARNLLIKEVTNKLGIYQTSCAEKLFYIKNVPGVRVLDTERDFQIHTSKFSYVVTRTRVKFG